VHEQLASFGTSGGECVPWQLVFLFGRRENDMESELVTWSDCRIISFINRSKKNPCTKNCNTVAVAGAD